MHQAMNEREEKQQWIDFLNSHDEFEQEFFEGTPSDIASPEKQYGLTLFNGEPDGYFMVFNTQIDIFQFVRLLRYFFGIDGIDVGHIDDNNHHFHTMNNNDEDDYDENDDD